MQKGSELSLLGTGPCPMKVNWISDSLVKKWNKGSGCSLSTDPNRSTSETTIKTGRMSASSAVLWRNKTQRRGYGSSTELFD